MEIFLVIIQIVIYPEPIYLLVFLNILTSLQFQELQYFGLIKINVKENLKNK